MSNTKSVSNGGIGVGGLLGCIFVTLKLCGIVDWSWWWVTAPFWGGFALFLVVAVSTVIVIALAALAEWLVKKGNQ